MKHRDYTRADTGEQVPSSGPVYGPKGPKTSCNAAKGYRKPGPILMCWRAYWPQDAEDPDVESMSSAGNRDI